MRSILRNCFTTISEAREREREREKERERERERNAILIEVCNKKK